MLLQPVARTAAKARAENFRTLFCDGRALLSKLAEDRGTSDMMITLADCLKDYIRTGINEEVLREQLRLYTES